MNGKNALMILENNMKPSEYMLMKHTESLLERSQITMEIDSTSFVLKAPNGIMMGAFENINEIYQFVTGYMQGVSGRYKIT